MADYLSTLEAGHADEGIKEFVLCFDEARSDQGRTPWMLTGWSYREAQKAKNEEEEAGI